MTFTLNNANLQRALEKKGHPVQSQPGNDQLYFVKRYENIETVMFFRILDGGELLQIMTALPFPLKEELKTDVARLLHKLNLDLDMPGFGMDEHMKIIFYRSVFPTPNKTCEEALLERYIALGPRAAASFSQVIAVVAQGHMTYDELIKRSRDL